MPRNGGTGMSGAGGRSGERAVAAIWPRFAVRGVASRLVVARVGDRRLAVRATA